MFFHFSEEEIWWALEFAWGCGHGRGGKVYSGSLLFFGWCWTSSHILSEYGVCNTSVQHSKQEKINCSILWLFYSYLVLYLTLLASLCELCLCWCWGTCLLLCSEESLQQVLLPVLFYLYLRWMLFPQDCQGMLARWALGAVIDHPRVLKASVPSLCKGLLCYEVTAVICELFYLSDRAVVQERPWLWCRTLYLGYPQPDSPIQSSGIPLWFLINSFPNLVFPFLEDVKKAQI